MRPEADLGFAAAFAPALLDPVREVPAAVAGRNGKPAGRR